MSAKYPPPKFIDDASEYSEYKKKLLRWSRITKVDKKQQAEVVLYHLEDHSSGIQQKIDTLLGDEVIDKEDGMTKLIGYLDSVYEEDEMTNMWSKYKNFVRLKKADGQPINEFIAEFESAYKEAKENGCEVSDTVLALNLLESCRLSETDEKFVLTAVDFKVGKERKDCLAQVKNSLRKFQSRDRMADEKRGDRFQIKDEDTFIANIKDALFADGWRPPQQASSSKDQASVLQNSPAYKGKKNKLGSDGKPLKCFKCDSEYHLAYDCEENVGRNGKNEKNKDGKSSTKSKKKSVEQSMLTKLLSASKNELAIVCNVYDECSSVDSDEESLHIDKNEELVMVVHDERELCCLVEDAGCRGVLDSGCSRSVAGLSWVNQFTKAISPKFSDFIELAPSKKIYQFGGGEKRKSKGTISLPTMIGDIKVFITMDVVDAPIPLLIGTNSMEKGEAVLDIKSKEATFFNEVVPMYKVGSGLYCIDLISENMLTFIDDQSERNEKVHNALLSKDDVNETDLKKLHHYYGHTSAEKLLTFLKNAGKDTTDLRNQLTEIESSCQSCKRSKRRKPRPKTAIPRVDGPNQIVTIDLKEWSRKGGRKQYICYIIDMHSRLTTGGFISDKEPDSIVNCILKHWISVFGVMKGIHSDIGGELSNKVLQDVAHKLGIELTTTAAYSPHQNGLNERNHSVVDLMITRMLESDKTLSPETAFLWALNAKNSLDNHLGFSSFQLHIGMNPVLPSATRDAPPSYDNTSKSKSFVSHLNAMMSAREQFIKAEASYSLKTALKSRVYPRGADITEGDRIYYKKNDGKGKNVIWQGPSKVVAVNGKKLFIDQGARLGTVNRDDALRVGEEFWRIDELPDDKVQGDIHKSKQREKNVKRNDEKLNREKNVKNGKKLKREKYVKRNGEKLKEVVKNFKFDHNLQKLERDSKMLSSESSSSESEEDVNGIEEEQEDVEDSDDTDECEGQDEDDDSVAEDQVELEEEVDNGVNIDNTNDTSGHERNANAEFEDQIQNIDTENEIHSETEYEDAVSNSESSEEMPAPNSSHVNSCISCEDIHVGDVIEYQIPKSGVTEIAHVLSRGGKASGPNKHWWNVKVQASDELKSVNTAAVQNLNIVTAGFTSTSVTAGLPSSVIPALIVSIPRYRHNEPECLKAKQEEIDNWKEFGVFMEVEDLGQKTINTNWVLIKKDAGIKARLCIRGDQEPEKEHIRTDSPTANKVNIKLFYVIAICKGWIIRTADIKAAFLQGAEIERDVFVKPPVECRKEGVIWKMVKRAYGFVDASRGFYIELESILLNLGCRQSLYDPALYMYYNSSSGLLSGLLLTHVDDFIHGSGDNGFIENVMLPLKEHFRFGREEEMEFNYVGMHVVQSEDEIVIDQNRYIENLEEPHFKNSVGEGLDLELDEEGQAEYRAVVGRIGWISNSTRPDMAYDYLVLSMKLGNASNRDAKYACKVIKKLKYEGTDMKFVNLGPVEEWTLKGFGDAGFKSLPDKTSSCEGQVILLANMKKSVACVVSWKSKKLKRIAASSTAAEALAVNGTLDEMVYIQSVLKELLGEIASGIPLVLATDSINLHDNILSTTSVDNPRLCIDVAILKESLKNRELSKFIHVIGKKMIADVLTKKGAASERLMQLLRTCKISWTV